MHWYLRATGVRERVPVLVADYATWKNWLGDKEPSESFDHLEGVNDPIELDGRTVLPFGYEGGVFDVGVDLGQRTLIVLQRYDNEDGATDELRDTLQRGSGEEETTGEFEVAHGVVIGDSWFRGDTLGTPPNEAGSLAPLMFFVPLPPGRYTVTSQQSDDGSMWYRLRPSESTR